MHGWMLYPQPALEQGDKEAASEVEERTMWEAAGEEPIATMEHTMCREAEPEVSKPEAKMRTADEEARAPARA